MVGTMMIENIIDNKLAMLFSLGMLETLLLYYSPSTTGQNTGRHISFLGRAIIERKWEGRK